MASYNLFLAEVTQTGFTVEPSGTALAAINKEKTEAEEPAASPLLKGLTAGENVLVKLALPGALSTELAEGAKIVALTVHVSVKSSQTNVKGIKVGWGAIIAEPSINTIQKWVTCALTKAQAEEQTQTTLETLTKVIERISGNLNIYEVYVSVETEKAATAINLSCSTTVQVPGTAKVNEVLALGSHSSVQMSTSAKVNEALSLASHTSVTVPATAPIRETLGLRVPSVVKVTGASKLILALGLKGATTVLVTGQTTLRTGLSLRSTALVLFPASARITTVTGGEPITLSLHTVIQTPATVRVRTALSLGAPATVRVPSSARISSTGSASVSTIYAVATQPAQMHIAVTGPTRMFVAADQPKAIPVRIGLSAFDVRGRGLLPEEGLFPDPSLLPEGAE